ncbi:unnamed protein product [Dovyalis caffra]|uniref:Uncharacterized protein n=1 Tax=Dovyalis caffra TaxID=77055 RepID=A0AAV1SW26_9ROSI|nr:unnamed protein product [Dovyalis caffra]
MATLNASFEFTVQRCEPELVAPAKPTPREIKQLSDIDHQISLQYHAPFVQIFAHSPSMQGADPAKVIREALAQALVFYYPFAGRMREGPDKKLIVDCTGEGVLFIEAEADVTLEQFGDPIKPPIPCFDELLHNVPGSDGMLNSPLLLFQVTRLKCGGFIVANRFNHAICDGIGIVNFLICVGEMARGANAPSILPVWQREVLNARDPPCITYTHKEYVVVDEDHVPDAKGKALESESLVHRSFYLGAEELSNVGRLFPSHLQPSTKFEMLTACIWKCYAIASESPNPNEELFFQVTVNARTKFNPPIPKGYYGNVVAMPVSTTTVGNLCSNSLGYALELVRKAKFEVNEEYMKSLADLIAIKRGQLKSVQPYELTDLRHIGYDQVDYGWGEAVYSGTPNAWPYDNILGAATYYVPFKTKKGRLVL